MLCHSRIPINPSAKEEKTTLPHAENCGTDRLVTSNANSDGPDLQSSQHLDVVTATGQRPAASSKPSQQNATCPSAHRLEECRKD